MLSICCAICKFQGNETAFHNGGEAHIQRPASHSTEVTDTEQETYLFYRLNTRGIIHERWLCRSCGKWFHTARDTTTMDFKTSYKITDPKPEIPPTKHPAKDTSP